MVELVFRLALALAAVLLSQNFNQPSSNDATIVASILGVSGVALFLLERQKKRNPGTSGLFAVIDSALIAFMLHRFEVHESFGFLVLVPLAYSVAKFGSNPAAMAPIAASALLGFQLLLQGEQLTLPLFAQSASVLILGMMLNQPRIVRTIERPVVLPDESLVGKVHSQYLELKESFRKLRDHAVDLERRSKGDRIVATLYDASRGMIGTLQERLAARIHELVKCDGVALYSASHLSGSLVVRAIIGDLPSGIAAVTQPFDLSMSDYQIRAGAERAIRALKTPDERHRTQTILLKDRGRLVGMLCLSDQDATNLEKATARADELAPVAAMLLREGLYDEVNSRRLREAELLYSVASTTLGAETSANLVSRVIREMHTAFKFTHLSVWFLDGKSHFRVAGEGTKIEPIDLLRLPAGKGLEGWLRSESCEVVIHATGDDKRCDRLETLKRRVGSMAILPIQFGSEPFGYVAVADHTAGSLDGAQLESLRTLVAELTHAIARLEGAQSGANGLMTPREFQSYLSTCTKGSLVFLEVLQRTDLQELFGGPAIEHVLRQFTARLRPTLPTNSAICRQASGDFIVFLSEMEEMAALRWANQATALASLVAFRTPDGTARVPLALKAKAADWTRQGHQVFERIAG